MTEWTTYSLKSSGVEETKRLGSSLASCLQPGDTIVLNGDLGAGKTQFVQGVAAALGVTGDVTSPTFNILLSYAGSDMLINHFDLYRLESEEELDDIGYWEVLENGGVTFIEWGDKFPCEMPDDYLELRISASIEGLRSIDARAFGARSNDLLESWKQKLEEQA